MFEMAIKKFAYKVQKSIAILISTCQKIQQTSTYSSSKFNINNTRAFKHIKFVLHAILRWFQKKTLVENSLKVAA